MNYQKVAALLKVMVSWTDPEGIASLQQPFSVITPAHQRTSAPVPLVFGTYSSFLKKFDRLRRKECGGLAAPAEKKKGK